jgi:DNA repair protein RecO (recombination protein O)
LGPLIILRNNIKVLANMQKYTAIILASRDISEYDRLYFMYTLEQGLVKVAAKGVRRPAAKLAGHLEPGTLSEVYIARSRGRGQVTSAITLSDFSHIKKDFEKLSNVLNIFSFFMRVFSEDEKDERIFKLLREYLEIIDRVGQSDQEELLTLGFWWKLFDALGQRPEVARCVSCGQMLKGAQKNYFSAEKGGIVCFSCATPSDSLPMGDNQIKLIRVYLANPLKKIIKVKADRKDLEGLRRVRQQFLKYNFG